MLLQWCFVLLMVAKTEVTGEDEGEFSFSPFLTQVLHRKKMG